MLKTAPRGAAARTFRTSIDATITVADARACVRHGGYALIPIDQHSPRNAL